MVCLRQIHLTVSVMPPFLSSLFVNAHCLFLLIVTEVIINPFLFLCSLIQKFSKSKPFFLSHSAKCPLRNLPTHCCIWASLIPILEGLPLKRSFYFSLLGLPVFQNKNPVLVFKAFLCLFLTLYCQCGISFLLPKLPSFPVSFLQWSALWCNLNIRMCLSVPLYWDCVSLWCLNKKEIVIAEEMIKNV